MVGPAWGAFACGFRLKHILTMYVLILKAKYTAMRSRHRRSNDGSREAAIPPLNVIGGKGAAMSQSTAHANEIDVRSLIPAKRHEKIFQLVG